MVSSKILKIILKLNNMTVNELTKRTGMSYQVIQNRVERGCSNYELAEDILKEFNIDLDDLYKYLIQGDSM